MIALPKQKLKSLIPWQTEIITFLIIILCFFLVYLFPAQGNFQKFNLSLFFFIILPILYIKFILKKSIKDFGLSWGDKKNGLFWGLGMLVVSFIIIFALARFTNFENNYLIPAYIADNFWLFLFYELILVNFLFFSFEFFLKGFVLFSFADKFGYGSIIIQAALYALFLLLTKNFGWQTVPIMILAVTGGLTAYKSKSILYSYLIGMIFLIVLDAYIIYIFK